LKEGFYVGRHLASDHPAVVGKKFNMGPNQYPDSLSDPEKFRTVVDEYHSAMMGLARKVLKVLALTLGLEEDWFEEFAAGQEPMAVLRLLHYPAQEPSSEGALEKGKSCFWRRETSVVKEFI
jgi:isopenicillin N synthase-like dioxygenase